VSGPAYGRYQVAEPPSALAQLHVHDGASTLKEVDHETPIAVLDQSDLIAQGIHCSRFIPGCKTDPEALGSCTANADMAHAAAILPEDHFLALCKEMINSSYAEHPDSYGEPVKIERGAIGFYFNCTHQTGDPSQEWPPTDCGSSGPYVYSEMQRLGFVKGQLVTSAGEALVSLLQKGGVLVGSPFFYSWEAPDAQGFVDGDGTAADLEAAIASGVAGGHEKYIAAIEKLTLLPTGHVDPVNTILRERNSWSRTWGDEGCCRIHLSTWVMLNSQCDFRQLVV
jgi:hypothetical protein